MPRRPVGTVESRPFDRPFDRAVETGRDPARRPPTPAPVGALLGTDARQALQDAGLDLPPESRATEDELWSTALSRAEETTSLWRARLDSRSRPSAASYYFEVAAHESGAITDIAGGSAPERSASSRELAIGLARGWPSDSRRPSGRAAWDLIVRAAAPIEQSRRSFSTTGRHEGAVPGVDVAALIDPETKWSASRLESYRTCPFQFFSQYALRLRELDEESDEADAATRGTVMHEMLEDALAPLVEALAPLDDVGFALAVEHLRTRGRAIWEEAPRKHAFGRTALWLYETDAALDALESMLRREVGIAEALGVERVIGGERHFVQPLPGVEPPLIVQASLDRIDEAGDTVHIVDYKTGRLIPRADVFTGRRLQLQLYAVVARAELGARRTVARYSFLRPQRSPWWLDSDRPDDAAALADAVAVASEVRREVAAGSFQVDPKVPVCPSYCSYRTACRVNEFSRSKTWS